MTPARRICTILAMLAMSSIFIASPAAAEEIDSIVYSGRLASQGNLVNGPLEMTFELFTSATGGEAVWNETYDAVTIDDGEFEVELGSQNSIVDALTGDKVYLQITIAGETLSPRTSIAAAPIAIKALDANTVGGFTAGELQAGVDGEGALGQELADLRARIEELERKTAAMDAADVGGHPSVVFSGVNVHVQNGLGATDSDPTDMRNGELNPNGNGKQNNGLGNLIIGYNEDSDEGLERNGSHNLVMGTLNSYDNAYGSIISGTSNTVTAAHAASIGGQINTVSGQYSAAVGGAENTVLGRGAGMIAGTASWASSRYSAGIAGHQNTVLSENSAIVGGRANMSYSPTVFAANAIIGGQKNFNAGTSSVIVGGGTNEDLESGDPSSYSNNIADKTIASVIVGGHKNFIQSDNATIVSGLENSITQDGPGLSVNYYPLHAAIFGGRNNTASGYGSTITGGRENTTASGAVYSHVSSGRFNTAAGEYSAVLGGGSSVDAMTANRAVGGYSVVAGGSENRAFANFSFVAGGYDNFVGNTVDPQDGSSGSVFGGAFNGVSAFGNAPGTAATVCGGSGNRGYGQFSVAVGGADNLAIGNYSTAAGGQSRSLTTDYSN